MALPTGHLISGVLGLVAGAAVTVALMSGSDIVPSVPREVATPDLATADIEAAIAADPSLCGDQGLEIPTVEDAQAAFQRARGATFPNVTITIGHCDKDTIGPGVACMDTIGPGVACMSRIVWGPGEEPADRLVGFAKSPDGWVATLY